MTTVETNVWMALKGRAEAAAAEVDLPLVLPAVVYTPTGEPFLTVMEINDPPQQVTIGGGVRLSGSLTLVLVARLGQASEVYRELAGRVAEYFKLGTCLKYRGQTVNIDAPPHVLSGYLDGPYWRVPIKASWAANAASNGA